MNETKLRGGLLSAVAKYDSVRCAKCGYVKRMSEDRKALAFAHGWPEHCGETMGLHVRATATTKEPT